MFRLLEHARRRAEFGGSVFGLQFQIDFIEHCQRLADVDSLAHFNETLQDLARDAETHIGLNARPDGADERSLGRQGFIVDGRHQHGARLLALFGRSLAAGAQRQRDPS